MRAVATESRGRVPRRAGQIIITQSGQMRLLDRINNVRLANQLVSYVDPSPDSYGWPTNQSGTTVYVNEAGVVTDILWRTAPPVVIPEGHWVLSGHRTAEDWLIDHAPVGTQIYVI